MDVVQTTSQDGRGNFLGKSIKKASKSVWLIFMTRPAKLVVPGVEKLLITVVMEYLNFALLAIIRQHITAVNLYCSV